MRFETELCIQHMYIQTIGTSHFIRIICCPFGTTARLYAACWTTVTLLHITHYVSHWVTFFALFTLFLSCLYCYLFVWCCSILISLLSLFWNFLICSYILLIFFYTVNLRETQFQFCVYTVHIAEITIKICWTSCSH